MVKRLAAEEIAQENVRSAHLKKLTHEQQEAEAKREAQDAFKKEESWWNYGAATEKVWLPEHLLCFRDGHARACAGHNIASKPSCICFISR